VWANEAAHSPGRDVFRSLQELNEPAAHAGL
jgi:hypothetical protein